MKVSSPPLSDVSAEQRDAIVRKWLARTLESYPEQTSRFLLADKDRFRNPVGHVLTTGLPVLFDQVAGGLDRERVRPVLDEIVRIRATQDFLPGEAIGFIFPLRQIVREELDPRQYDPTALENCIDKLALYAVDLFVECRDRMAQIKVQDARRRAFVLERMAAREVRAGT